MRILQLANGYLKTKVYSLLFPQLEKLGVEETVFVPVKRGESIPEHPENVHIVPCFDQLDRLLFYRKQRSMLRWLEENTDLASFDAVHAHTVFSGGYAAYQIHKRYGTPYVVAVRSTDVHTFFQYMVHLRRLGVEILRHAACVVFLSPAYQKDVLEKWIPRAYRQEILEKSRVIPNGIDPLFLDNRGSLRTQPHDPLRLVYVGKINAVKNPELTVKALGVLERRGIGATLTAVGKIYSGSYEKLFAQSPLVTHHPRCSQQEVLEHLRQGDIFVMPSHAETFGLVYAEAMSQGLPVLYTAGQGFDGHFPDGTVGYAVSDTDPEALADAICRVTENYEALSAGALAGVGRFDWTQLAVTYEAIYRSL